MTTMSIKLIEQPLPSAAAASTAMQHRHSCTQVARSSVCEYTLYPVVVKMKVLFNKRKTTFFWNLNYNNLIENQRDQIKKVPC